MATGTITSLGIGSSLDLQGILDSLREADEASITLKEQEISEQEAIKEELNVINSKLYSMKTSALNLSLGSNYISREVTVSASDIVSASAIDGAATGTYDIEVNRLAVQSSYLSLGKSLSTSSVYVPTIQNSVNGFADTDITVVLAEDEEMSVNYGIGDDRKTVTITGTAGGMTLDDIIAAFNADPANDDGEGSTYITASTYEGEDGLNYLQFAATSGGTGEENRVMVTTPPDATGFSAQEKTFSYSLGDSSDIISLSIGADTTLENLAALINDDENNPGVTASVLDTGIGENPYQLMIKADNTGENSRIHIVTGLDDLVLEEANGAGFSMESDNAISFSDPIIITQSADNNQIVFQEDAGDGASSDLTATIADGVYQDGDTLAAAIEAALEEASKENGNSMDYLVTFDENSGKLRIQESGMLETLTIKWEEAGSTAASALGFSETKTLTPATSSLNASLSVDSIMFQRQTNTSLSDVIEGTTLSLLSTGNATIGITSDTSVVQTEVENFITLFNDLIAEIDANDDYDEDTETWGTLAKSYSISSAKNTLLSLLTTPLNTGTDITSMIDLGLEIDREGTISLDEETLTDWVTSNFQDIETLFLGDDSFTGLADTLNDQLTEYTKSQGLLDSEIEAVDSRITRLEDDIETEIERLDKKYEILTQQYVALDSYLQQMESLQSYVSEIFSATSGENS